jgi:3-oxoacyl-[acyl-carrier-protein] synthase-3
MSRPHVRSAAYEVQQRKSLATLCAELAVPEELQQAMRDRGFEWYWEESRSMGVACALSGAKTLARAGCTAADVDAVVFARSDECWTPQDDVDLHRALGDLGIGERPIFGLSLQSCSGCASALQVASGLLGGPAAVRRVLVILFGRARGPAGRINTQTGSVFSDGAASCLVTAEAAGLEILACTSVTSPELAVADWSGAGFHSSARSAFRLLSAALDRLYQLAGLGAADIDILLGTNGNEIHLEMLAEAAGVPVSRVYKDNLARFAHVYAGDTLISLATRLDEGGVAAGSTILLVGWSPHVVSASVLRATAMAAA